VALVGCVLAPAKAVKRLTRWAAALLDAFDLVDPVADEFEEAGHDLAQGGVEGG
jgi:hypothetical protein